MKIVLNLLMFIIVLGGCSSVPTRSELAKLVNEDGKDVVCKDKKVTFWLPNSWKQEEKTWISPKTKAVVKIQTESRFPDMDEHLNIIAESIKQQSLQTKVNIVSQERINLHGRPAGVMTLKVTTPDSNYRAIYTAIDIAGIKYTLVIRTDDADYKTEEKIFAKMIESFRAFTLQ